jgi:glycosyltransferase involved in cell wall biosynthesis
MEAAKCNFFVSKALMAASDKITAQARKEVLYNGVSEDFVEFSAEKKAAVRERYGLSPEDVVVAFVGNLVPVKNVLVLPELFANIASGFSGSLKFWIVGDGKLRNQLETACLSRNCEERTGMAVRFFGNQPSSVMPDIMNCIDVLLIPSLNEGLPLVCAEALRCGANVVGSDVGGIAEVIGAENVVRLGDGFVDALTGKALSYLAARSGHTPSDDVASQSLLPDFSWERTAALELSFIQS